MSVNPCLTILHPFARHSCSFPSSNCFTSWPLPLSVRVSSSPRASSGRRLPPQPICFAPSSSRRHPPPPALCSQLVTIRGVPLYALTPLMVKNLFREDRIKTLIDPLENITCFMLLARQAFRKCRIVVVLLLIEYAIRMRIVMVLAPGTHARTHERASARGHTHCSMPPYGTKR